MVWKILLDDEFLDAYRNGIIGEVSVQDLNIISLQCGCRALLATIRDKGRCLCPHCLTPKIEFHFLGLLADASQRAFKICTYFHEKVTTACNAIYNLGSPIKGTIPEAYLKYMSLVPTCIGQLESIVMHNV